MRGNSDDSAALPLLTLPNRLLTIQEAADYLSVSVRWVQDAVQQRRIRCTRIGKHVRIAPDHLAELIASGEQPVAYRVQGAVVPDLRDRRRSRL
jgi:excisionase family DNA binding protein